MDADESRQVRVRFVTKLPPPLRAPTTAIAVPAELSRMGLSEIVNSLILSGERVRPLTLTPLGRDVPGVF
jgi:ribosome biogenesis protein YTM1